MPDDRTEMQKRDILRLSNREANRLTRECIQTALIHLMAVKDIDRISVSELVRKAGVSRTAFYNNYTSMYGVLQALTTELLDELNRLAWEAIIERRSAEVYTKVFERIKEEASLFSLLMKSERIEQSIVDVRRYMSDHYPDMEPEVRYYIYACGGMVRSVIIEWFMSGMTEEPAEMAQLCDRMSAGILDKIKTSVSRFPAVSRDEQSGR